MDTLRSHTWHASFQSELSVQSHHLKFPIQGIQMPHLDKGLPQLTFKDGVWIWQEPGRR